MEEMVKKLKKPRRVMMLVKAGAAVDSFIDKLVPLLEKGDIIIDGGNSEYTDTQVSEGRGGWEGRGGEGEGEEGRGGGEGEREEGRGGGEGEREEGRGRRRERGRGGEGEGEGRK